MENRKNALTDLKFFTTVFSIPSSRVCSRCRHFNQLFSFEHDTVLRTVAVLPKNDRVKGQLRRVSFYKFIGKLCFEWKSRNGRNIVQKSLSLVDRLPLFPFLKRNVVSKIQLHKAFDTNLGRVHLWWDILLWTIYFTLQYPTISLKSFNWGKLNKTKIIDLNGANLNWNKVITFEQHQRHLSAVK